MQLPPMRFFFLTASLFLAAFSPLRAADVELTRVWPGWRDAESFERIAEFFTGKEHTGKQVILRSRPETRGGYYFYVRAVNPGPQVADAKFVLQVITPASPTTKTYTFPTRLGEGTTVFNLGLTGEDWPGKDAAPVAWKIELVSGDGRTLAAQKSFLWEKPAK
jgi:hypothetical protein